MFLSDVSHLILLIWLVWLLGAAILAVLSLVPATSANARDLWKTFGTQALVVVSVTTPFLANAYVLMALMTTMAMRIGYESGVVQEAALKTSDTGKTGLGRAGAVLIALLAIFGWFLGPTMPPGFAAGLAVIVAAILIAASSHGSAPGTPRTRALAFMAAYPGIAIATFAFMSSTPRWHIALVVAFLLVEVFDSFALLGGRLFGSTHVFPRLSSRKTLEGLITGFAALALVVCGLAWLAGDWSLAGGAALAIVVAVAAVLGDLAASWVKRRAKVKDYPQILARQGGLLDILDSWLAAAPFVVAIFVYFEL